MGFMDEMKKLVKPYADDDEDDFDDFDAPEAPAPRPSPSAFDDTVYTGSSSRNKVLNINIGLTMSLRLQSTCATGARWC